MAYTASQNPKTGTTYTAAALFATLILAAGIAALAMHPAEAFAKPLCVGVGPCYAGVNANASAADGASSLRDGMACMRSAIEGKLCAKRCLSGNGAAFIDENGNGICDNYETAFAQARAQATGAAAAGAVAPVPKTATLTDTAAAMATAPAPTATVAATLTATATALASASSTAFSALKNAQTVKRH